LNGIYDQVPGKWREPVNVPNGLYVRFEGAGEMLDHEQDLDLRAGLMKRRTSYVTPTGTVRVSSQRFASQDDVHLLCLEYLVEAGSPAEVTLHSGIDSKIWDINGPHLSEPVYQTIYDIVVAASITRELGVTIVVAECVDWQGMIISAEKGMRKLTADAAGEVPLVLHKYVAVFTSADGTDDPVAAAIESCRRARRDGFEKLLLKHRAHWERIWQSSDVQIDGDPEAQFALRYSLYQLNLAAPRHSDQLSIPARGLSGQVYKGAVFWDTEMFMTPVFSLTDPAVARNLILYRFHTLNGARRKAAEYGFRGAFYAWESQETGDDACTLFNVTDVFTGRPMRTYFRDKQIHISADIVHAIRHYLDVTGDLSILAAGAAEVAAECARFLYSYAVFKPDRGRFELHDVTGPDEYHERVNNNAYTNRIAKSAVEAAVDMLETLGEKDPAASNTAWVALWILG
jgi:trehalose/maltose hydrolase-like predicted phosphorylase